MVNPMALAPQNQTQTKLHSSCSVFTAEIIAVLFALEEISDRSQRYFIVYTDSLSVLQSLSSFYPHPHNHPLVLNVLDLFNKLALRGFNIMLCWVPSHVRIVGDAQADRAAKLAVAPMDITIPVGCSFLLNGRSRGIPIPSMAQLYRIIHS
ncbi:hypothetical protein AVEN_206940-1 [Araneus ventricosus]|uniref:RNase H type-1 domain-containing protein n=1 Tax=Araneus ventricosus TaxID=182803 RepID=A0A4Y2PU27_ARAVE|nr:hypothetical protein AVEN_206940-1 [Araneus ventricosus]